MVVVVEAYALTESTDRGCTVRMKCLAIGVEQQLAGMMVGIAK